MVWPWLRLLQDWTFVKYWWDTYVSFFISEFGYEATKWLIEQRSIVGIGTECPDIELTQKGEVKLLLSTRGHFSIMQLTNVDQLPMRGFSVTMAPLKLQVKLIYSENATKI